jgi:hypothetical protein
MLCLSVMTLTVVGSTVSTAQYKEWPATAGFGLAAAWVGVGAARSLFVGVFARPEGIVARHIWRTVTIPWAEVTEISNGKQQSGAAGAIGATTPFVMRTRPGHAPRRVELNVLGGYGLSPKRPTPAEVAVADLNAHLATWRDQQVSTEISRSSPVPESTSASAR